VWGLLSFGWSYAPGPTRGAYSALQVSQLDLRSLLLTEEGEGVGDGKVRWEEEEEGWRMGWSGKEGKGNTAI